MSFANPWLLAALLAVPLLIAHQMWQHKKRASALRLSTVTAWKPLTPHWTQRFRRLLLALRFVTLGLLVLALARPQLGYIEEDILTEGVDIMITLDISGSMAAEDFSPRNRLHVAKEVVRSFIQGRRYDRIGMVIFSADSYTKCPLTLDYGVLLRLLDDVQLGSIRDGTAIGTAISTSVNRLKPTRAKSKVIILLTDGVNNTGEIDPVTAAEIAKAFGIKIYAIGVGSQGYAPFPATDAFGGKRYVQIPVEIDEQMLQLIARNTEGRYFRATDRDSLERIFKTINELEKSEVQVKSYSRYDELFQRFLLPALGLLLIGVFLTRTRFRKLP